MALSFQWFQREKDFQNQRELFSLAFPETVGSSINTTDHYNWKFKSFPHSPASYEFAAHEENVLCGYYAALPYTYMIQGTPHKCGMVCDVMTHPGFRGKGIFAKLGAYSTSELQKAGVDFTSGYPIRPEVIPGHLKVGWFIAFKAPMYIRVLKADSLLKSGGLGFLSFLINPLLKLLNVFLSSRNSRFSVRTSGRDEFLKGNHYDDFFGRWTAGQKNYLLKSREFLGWRTAAPHTEYNFSGMYDGAKLVGLAITRPTVLKNVPSLAVLDFMMDPSYEKHSGTLFSHLTKLAAASKSEVLVMMINSYWQKRYRLLRHFFIPSPAVFSVIFKILNSKVRETFKNSSDWHLTWIDCDDL